MKPDYLQSSHNSSKSVFKMSHPPILLTMVQFSRKNLSPFLMDYDDVQVINSMDISLYFQYPPSNDDRGEFNVT